MFFALLLGLAGCNAVTVHRLSPDRLTGEKHFSRGKNKLPGVVYYEPAPFLKVTVTPSVTKSEKDKSSKTTWTVATEIIYLPDPTRPYSINAGGSGGTNNLELKLKDGWMLESVNGQVDPQIDETITALGSLVPSLLGGGAEKAADSMVGGGPPIIHILLYRVRLDPTNPTLPIELIGEPIKIDPSGQGQQLIGGTKLNSAVTVPQSASGGPVALLPANGDTVFVLDSYRGSVFPFGEMVATKVSLMSEAEFGSFVRDWDWSDGDRLLSAGSSCTGRLASCAVQCEKLGSEYRTRRVEQTARCVPVSDPRATCWSTYRVQCRESWYTDAACTQVSAKAPAHFYSNSCDP